MFMYSGATSQMHSVKTLMIFSIAQTMAPLINPSSTESKENSVKPTNFFIIFYPPSRKKYIIKKS